MVAPDMYFLIEELLAEGRSPAEVAELVEVGPKAVSLVARRESRPKSMFGWDKHRTCYIPTPAEIARKCAELRAKRHADERAATRRDLDAHRRHKAKARRAFNLASMQRCLAG